MEGQHADSHYFAFSVDVVGTGRQKCSYGSIINLDAVRKMHAGGGQETITLQVMALMVFSCSLGHVYRKKEPLVDESNGILSVLSYMCPLNYHVKEN